MEEEKKGNILEKYEPGRRQDYAYTAAFRIPYALQSVILLAVTGILLVLRGLLCLTSFGLILMAAAGFCFGVAVWQARKAGKTKKGIKSGGIRMEEVSRSSTRD